MSHCTDGAGLILEAKNDVFPLESFSPNRSKKREAGQHRSIHPASIAWRV